MSPHRALVLAVLTLALSSCGGGGQNGDGGQHPVDRLPSKPREAPPAGVAAQVSFFEIGDGTCPTEANAPTVRFYGGYPREGEVEIARPHFDICLLGFVPGRSVDVTVRRADGREVRRHVPATRETPVYILIWVPVPGDPVGRYMATARQGTASASGSFSVRPATSPRVIALEPSVNPGSTVSPGGSVHIAFAGFQPGQDVRFHLYRQPPNGSGRYSYLTSLTAHMDESGQAVHELRTSPGAPPGTYLVRVSDKLQFPFHVGE